MVHTWIMDITPLRDENIYNQCYNRLPGFRQEKADRIRPLDGKMRSVGVWILYQKMLEHYHLTEKMPYNLSHSGRYALCSVSDQMGVQLGCDVEMIKANRKKLAERFFRPAEAEWIRRQKTGKEQAEGFCRYWVLKESFIKAVRLGMKQDLREFEIALDAEGARLVLQPDAFPERYYYQEYATTDGDARIAVCSTESEFDALQESEFDALHYLDEQNII